MGMEDAVMPVLLVVSVKFFVKDAALSSFPIRGDMNSPIGRFKYF